LSSSIELDNVVSLAADTIPPRRCILAKTSGAA
jgi:hypothetical protein